MIKLQNKFVISTNTVAILPKMFVILISILRGNEIMLKSWDTISAITQVLCDHYRDKNENSQDIDNPKILEIIFKEYRLKLFEYFNRDESWTKL